MIHILVQHSCILLPVSALFLALSASSCSFKDSVSFRPGDTAFSAATAVSNFRILFTELPVILPYSYKKYTGKMNFKLTPS